MTSNKTEFEITLNKNTTSNLKSIQFLLITLYLIFSLIISTTKSENTKKTGFGKEEKNRNKVQISDKDELKSFVELLLGEEMNRNYTQLNRAEQLFYDRFIQRMVDSYNYTDFSPESLRLHLTPENIDKQRELAFVDFTFNYHIIEDELKDQIKKNEPEPNDFYDDDLNKDEDEEEKINKNNHKEAKVNAEELNQNKGKNEL